MNRSMFGLRILQLQSARISCLTRTMLARSVHQSLGKSILYDVSTESPRQASNSSERGERPRTKKTFENRSSYGDQARTKRDTDRSERGDWPRTKRSTENRTSYDEQPRSKRNYDRSERGDRPRTKRDTDRSSYGEQPRSKRNYDRSERGDRPRTNRITDRSSYGERPRTNRTYDRSERGDRPRTNRTTDRSERGDQTRARGRTPSDDHSGFVKIKQRETREAGDARVTLTEKTQRAQMEWRQGRAGQMRLREQLKEPSLAGWQRRKIELKLKLGADGWEPEKKIATSSMEKIRLLNSEFPKEWTIKHLSEQFKISQESVRRILKSKFQSSEEHTEQREHQRKLKIRAFKRSEKGGSK